MIDDDDDDDDGDDEGCPLRCLFASPFFACELHRAVGASVKVRLPCSLLLGGWDVLMCSLLDEANLLWHKCPSCGVVRHD